MTRVTADPLTAVGGGEGGIGFSSQQQWKLNDPSSSAVPPGPTAGGHAHIVVHSQKDVLEDRIWFWKKDVQSWDNSGADTTVSGTCFFNAHEL